MDEDINSEIIDALGRVARMLKHKMSFHSRRSNITILQFEALWCIKKSKHVHMRDIANHFSTTMPTATSLINKLIATKLAVRRNDSRDRRIVGVSLTRQGEKLLRDLIRQREGKVNKLLSFLSISDKRELSRILQKMIEKSENYEK